VVLLLAGPTVSALAGVSRMRAAVFVPLAGANLLVRVVLVLGFAHWIRAYVETALAWIDAWWPHATALTVLAVVGYRWRHSRRLQRGIAPA
jgi:membrane protein DedA with SNARE-associated domain